MPAAYTNELRQKAVAAVHRGERQQDVCRMFHIGRNTLYLWLKRETETGDCQAKTGYQKGYGNIITDLEAFQLFVQQHPDKTQTEMAQLWPEEVSQRTISRTLKKIGFTRKKRPMATEKEMSKNGKSFSPD